LPVNVVDGPLTTFFGGRWTIDHVGLGRKWAIDHVVVPAAGPGGGVDAAVPLA
jgi:hypothetical protein